MAFPAAAHAKMAAMLEDTSPLSFIFVGNEMIVQCTAYRDDEPGAAKLLNLAMVNYQYDLIFLRSLPNPVLTSDRIMNDGKHAAVVRRKDSTKYWITSFPYAQTLDKDVYAIVDTTISE